MKVLSSLILASLFAYSCHTQNPQEDQRLSQSEKLFERAKQLMSEQQYDSALFILEQSFKSGFTNPMIIPTDSSFYPLIDDPEMRAKARALIKAYARQSTAGMVRVNEPGGRIIVEGRVLNEVSGRPVSGVVVELIQADSLGLYFNETSIFNPRLFAYLKTDKDGLFSVTTIRPGNYLDDDGLVVPAHIHFSLEHPDFRTYSSEMVLSDDSIFRSLGNTESVPVAFASDSSDRFSVSLEMQPN